MVRRVAALDRSQYSTYDGIYMLGQQMDCAERGDTEAIDKPRRQPEPIYELLAGGTGRWCRESAGGE